MFGKRRKKMFNRELLEEEKIILLKEYGTTDEKEISKMFDALDDYKFKLRCRNLELKYDKDYIRKNHIKLIHMIVRRYYHAAVERHALGIPLGSNIPTPSENIINDLDKLILLKQMEPKGYTTEQSEIIYLNINEKYRTSTCDLKSIDFDDYDVDENLNVTIKPTKDRYKNMLLKQEKNNDLEMQFK